MKHALAEGFTHAVTLDGDGQHLPEDISTLLRVARETEADLVIGERTFDRSLMPRARYYSNTVGSRWASAMVGRSEAAMAVCRPLPFATKRPPGVGDVAPFLFSKSSENKG